MAAKNAIPAEANMSEAEIRAVNKVPHPTRDVKCVALSSFLAASKALIAAKKYG
jgi:hypothetical protein